jgi:nucleotide-binding universal stress UspA family protein
VIPESTARVAAGPTGAAWAAVRWAAAEAARRGAPLRILVADPGSPDPPEPAALTAALRTARAPGPERPVVVDATGRPAAAAVRAFSAEAALLVASGSAPDLDAVVDGSFCPVVVVPDAARVTSGPVVLGAAPWTGPEVVDTAFDAAAARATTLLAVRTAEGPRIDLASYLPWGPSRGATSPDRARDDLRAALAAWTIAHPDVPVETLATPDEPTELLVALSNQAQLLVLGRSARGTVLARVAGSPVRALARRSRCPVMIVPAVGPPRRTLLPSRGVAGELGRGAGS